ncbi:DNA primase [Patescibacteria group bacterium]|nr:DNA primase [Patescibacteria group bacterium]MBU1563640.1 DNA primase [Patescibacteria group bacterium]MBU2068551.1 DNA primase [Patescibacteria group bacterium]
MTNNPVDDIKNKLDVVDLISGYIQLQKAGRNYKAPCPFHSEKTPSFMVSPERQLWKCFGCGRGGSVFDFVMEMEGVEFGDALKILAQRTGIELKKMDPKLKTERTRLYEVCQLANLFFIKQLEASKAGKGICGYLNKRGLKTKTIKEWQIGYAPNQWRSLKDFLNKQGYSDGEILKAGLSVDKGYDRFRDRIMFPISDLNGLIIGFTGRENPDHPIEQMGKYINTPNSLIYDKSRVLYGLDKAKLDIKQNQYCILVEGQTDVIMSHQAGFTNTVASSGTALTDQQLGIIKRYTENLTMAFDMDNAGEIATKRGIDLALQFGFNTKIISLPDNQDPANYINKKASLWKEAISKAYNVMEFYITTAFSKNNAETAEGKKEIGKITLPVIKKISNKVEQSHWLQELAKRLKVQEKVLIEEMEKIKENDFIRLSDSRMNNSAIRKPNAIVDLEEYTLGLILTDNKILKKCRDEDSYLFANPELKEIFLTIKKTKNKNNLPSNLIGRIDEIIFGIEVQKELAEEFKPNKEVKFCFAQLKKRYFRKRLNQLNLDIQEAEGKKDKISLRKLTEEFNQLSKQMII